MQKWTDEADREVYQVPRALGAHFKPLFEEVDRRLSDLNIAGYTVRTSSLEEVFIKIGQKELKG